MAATYVDPDELRLGMFGAMVAHMEDLLPEHDERRTHAVLKSGPAKYVKPLREAAERVLALAMNEHAARAERTLALVKTRKLHAD